jgi:hypothetical protein
MKSQKTLSSQVESAPKNPQNILKYETESENLINRKYKYKLINTSNNLHFEAV